MKVLVTGAGGFIGQFLARQLLQDPSNRVVLTDVVDFSVPDGSLHPENATIRKADLVSEASQVVDSDIQVVFCLHGIMSSGAEINFDLGFRINVDATRNLLDCIRAKAPGARVIYASSIAVFGRPFPKMVIEDVYPCPEGSYGAEKVICETIINDYTRRGFISGFSVRIPGITIRPGLPAQAASSFLGGIIREPLQRKTCIVPTKDRSKLFWVCSPKALVTNLIRIMNLPTTALPPNERVLNLPGSLVSIQEMRDALAKYGGDDKLKYIEESDNTDFEELVKSWPCHFDVSLAYSLGLSQAESFEKTVQDYLQNVNLNPAQ